MKIDVIRPRDLGEPELSAWRQMRRASPHLASPWLAPEFAQAVSHVRDAARVAVIWDDTVLAGFLPFEPCGPGAARPLAAWVTLAQGLVHRPGFEVNGSDLLKGCGLEVFEFEYLVGGQPWFTTDENRTAMLLDLESGYDGYIKFFRENSPKSYKTIAYKERKIQRDIGPLTYEYASNDHFGALLRWKSDQYRRIGRADRTAKPWVAALIERLRDVQTAEFSAPLSVLKIGDRPVAAHFGLVSEGVMAGWFPAYDPELGSYSPGLIHHLRLVEAAAARRLRHIDTGTAGDYKQTICNGSLPLSEGVARRPGAASALHWARTAPARRIKKTIVGNARLHALADRALKMRGRG